jgi:seryl-tRNA synthetase
MLAMDLIRRESGRVAAAIEAKNVDLDLDHLLQLDQALRLSKSVLENAQAHRNELTKRFSTAKAEEKSGLQAEVRALKTTIAEAEEAVERQQLALDQQLLRLPNIPYKGAPVGPDESFNEVIRTEGTPREFEFEPLDHVALIERNGWADLTRIVQVAGSRQYCLKGRLALLEGALMNWALARIADAGFTPITVPAMTRTQAFLNQGQFPGHEEEVYHLPKDELWLAGTAEVALTSLHSGEILDLSNGPVLYAGISPCFRREAGSAGRDVRGLLRVHQFLKVEQYVICEADEAVSAEWHARLLGLAEELLRELELPYQVIETSTGDMGLGKYRMNDIESWVPSLGKYRETHSCSTLHDWQARRANLRYRDADGKVRFAHTLNNTALASPRILVPLLENHQTEDGRVRLPDAIRPLLGGAEYL